MTVVSKKYFYDKAQLNRNFYYLVRNINWSLFELIDKKLAARILCYFLSFRGQIISQVLRLMLHILLHYLETGLDYLL